VSRVSEREEVYKIKPIKVNILILFNTKREQKNIGMNFVLGLRILVLIGILMILKIDANLRLAINVDKDTLEPQLINVFHVRMDVKFVLC
jgi:hypothetical protein